MGNYNSGRPFRDEDIQIIIEEVTFLMAGGYRAGDKKQIDEGLRVAIKGSSSDEWKRWTAMKLCDVIDDLHYLGTP